MKRILAIALTAAFAISAIGATALAAPGENNGQKAPNVWLCHYTDNHSADEADWSVAQPENVLLDGDYVINNPQGTTSGLEADKDFPPGAYCVTHGGSPIIVNANSLDKGHGAQLLNRVAQYEPLPV